MRHGRKFVVTVAGMVLTSLLSVAAMILGQPEPAAVVGSLALMVGAFNGSNAWATPKVTTTQGDA